MALRKSKENKEALKKAAETPPTTDETASFVNEALRKSRDKIKPKISRPKASYSGNDTSDEDRRAFIEGMTSDPVTPDRSHYMTESMENDWTR